MAMFYRFYKRFCDYSGLFSWLRQAQPLLYTECGCLHHSPIMAEASAATTIYGMRLQNSAATLELIRRRRRRGALSSIAALSHTYKGEEVPGNVAGEMQWRNGIAQEKRRRRWFPVGAGVVWSRVGTLASPWVEWGDADTGTGRGRRKRPHSTSSPPPPLRNNAASQGVSKNTYP